MKTDISKQERISALLDSELNDAQLDAAIASLSSSDDPESKETWAIYHQIGDVLRSDDLSVSLSADFSSKMKALLDAEPVILAPQPRAVEPHTQTSDQQQSVRRSGWSRYIAMSGVAAAAFVAFLLVPQMSVNLGDGASKISTAQVSKTIISPQNEDMVQLVSSGNAPDVSAKTSDQIEMLRDPRLDSYLQAHQKFSPSLENGSQYTTRASIPYSSSPAAASQVSEK